LPDSTIHFLRVLPYFHFLCFFFSCILLIILDMGFLVFRLCCLAIILGFLFLFGSSYKLEIFTLLAFDFLSNSQQDWTHLSGNEKECSCIEAIKRIILEDLTSRYLSRVKNSPEKRKRKPQLDMKKNILEKPLADELE